MGSAALGIEGLAFFAVFSYGVAKSVKDVRIVAITTSEGQEPRRLATEIEGATYANVVLPVERVTSIAIDN